MKVLVVEDSKRLRKSLSEGLRRSGIAVDLAADGESGLKFALAVDYDTVVLDLMLPRLDGLSVLKELRAGGKKTNVLILSARDQVQDRIRGLEIGADDYLVKPFSFEELLARIKALVRRRYDQRDPVFRLGRLKLDTALCLATCEDIELKLTPHEFSVLEYLAFKRGRVASTAALEDRLYTSSKVVSSNAIEVHISTLRKKLRAVGETELIKTRRGFGYYIEPD